MNETVGQITYDAKIDTKQLKADAAEAEAIAKNTGDSLGDSLERGSGRASSSLDNLGSRVVRIGDQVSGAGRNIRQMGDEMGTLGSSITRSALVPVVALGTGFGLVGKMAFDQVNSVQQATLALRAYEKDGNKVNQVLAQLLTYARSDLGVLFNRKDLFAAAQGLKVMGDSTDELVGHVEIMSRAVGLGTTTWEDLSEVVGRVGSTGRLTGIDFDNLTKAGYRLDPALRNTNITFNELFKALDKGIPVDALSGQADSIKGIGVRVQTSFRGIGEAILGVDKDTGQFVDGGAGDKLTQFFKNLPTILADPKIKESFRNIGIAFADFATIYLPKIITFIEFFSTHAGVIGKVTFDVLAFGVSLKILGVIMKTVGVTTQVLGFGIKGLGAIAKIATGETTLLGTRMAASGAGALTASSGIATLAASLGPYLLIAAAAVGVAGLGYLAYKKWGESHVDLGEKTKALTPQVQAFKTLAENLGVSLQSTASKVDLVTLAQTHLKDSQALVIAAAQKHDQAQAIYNATTVTTAQRTQAVADAHNAVTTALNNFGVNSPQYQAATQALSDRQWELDNALADGAVKSIDLTIKTGWLKDAMGELNIAVGNANSLQSFLNAQMEGGIGVIARFGPTALNQVGAIAVLQGAINTLVTSWNGFTANLQPQNERVNQILLGTSSTIQRVQGQSDALNASLQGGKSPQGGATFNPQHNATGTNFFKGGLTWVGEQGPELINPPRGSQIFPADVSKDMASSANVNIKINLSGIMARSRSDLRDIGKDIIRAVNDELGAKQQPLIGGGVL